MTGENGRFSMPDAQIYAEYMKWMIAFSTHGETEFYHFNLMEMLHHIPFEWYHHRDANRAIDGIDLRDLFSYETGIMDWYHALGGPCSVLEMLLGLAHRIDKEVMYDHEIGDRTNIWFWEMIHNLGLDEFDDSNFRPDIVEEKVNIWLNRKYDRDGFGSIFPVKNSQKDQRKIEIWAQAQEYFLENYGI